MSKVEGLLDRDGRGLMTPDLFEIFSTNKCEPTCHVCRSPILCDDAFRLKPWVKEKGEDVPLKTVKVMICGKCDESNKPLPFYELSKIADSLDAGFISMDHYRQEFFEKYEILAPVEQYKQPQYTGFRSGGCFVIDGEIVV